MKTKTHPSATSQENQTLLQMLVFIRLKERQFWRKEDKDKLFGAPADVLR